MEYMEYEIRIIYFIIFYSDDIYIIVIIFNIKYLIIKRSFFRRCFLNNV